VVATEKQASDARRVLENLPDAVLAVDDDGVVTFVNRAAVRMTGRASKAMVGRRLRDVLALLDGDTRRPVALPSAAALRGLARPVDPCRAVLTSARQRDCPVEVTWVAAPAGGVQAGGMLVCIRDIRGALVREREILGRQKIEAIGSMADNLVRDFHNWLNVISGHASSLAESLIPKTRAHEEARHIQEAVGQAAGLTNRLVSVAGLGGSEEEPGVRPVSTDAVIRKAVALAESTFAGPPVEFRAPGAGTVPPVLAGPDPLFDILMNLFRNAAEAMPDGGRITIDSCEQTVGGRTFVVLRVRDTGCGMTREVLDQAFEPFYSTRKSSPALGLGLTVTQSFVERWGGFVRIWSRPGRGTSVRLFLGRAATAARRSRKREAVPRGETILVADDHPDVRAHVGRTLEEAGYRVLSAVCGEECVSLYREHGARIALLLVDVIMPGKDGRSVFEEILSHDPGARLIAVSGFPRDYVRAYLNRAVSGFIQKPVEPEILLGVVRRCLHPETENPRADRADRTT